MAEAILQILIENLSSLIQREIGLIMGADKEMKKLFSTLTTIQKVLEDAEDKQLQNKSIQNWLIKLNDLAYEVEDILDECATEVSKLELKGSIFKLKNILVSHKIGRRMKEMAKKLDAVAAERHNFHLREIVTDCQKLSVLPIIGVGGLGKTTLAQLVFNDQRASRHFDINIWVCVSDYFDLKVLLKAMIESATGSASDLVHLDPLRCRLWEVLNQKRYLLILDDVWNDNQESWAQLESILACGSKGASIVVTTRQKNVADIMRTLPEEKTSILPVLRFSYHHLPLELRRCFVYCAVFPKDTRIEKQYLIFHWMAFSCSLALRAKSNSHLPNNIFHCDSLGSRNMGQLLYETPWDVPKIPSCKFSYPDFILEASGDNWRRMYVAQSEINKSETLRAESHSHQQSNSRFFRLQHLPSLQSLQLESLPQLTSLPVWLGNLTSLTLLRITFCPRVPSLPSSIQGMTNLRYLEIWGCPQLKSRCEKGKGEDWHKIAHIPQLYISTFD